MAERQPSIEGRSAVTGFPGPGYQLLKASSKFRAPKPLRLKKAPPTTPIKPVLGGVPRKSASTRLY